MKALFLSQSNSIDFFYEFQKNSKIFDEVAYVATDKEYYKKFLNKNPNFESENQNIFKDWELNEKSEKINHEYISHVENTYFSGYPSSSVHKMYASSFLSSAKIDRRYVGGLKSTYVQNYNKEFTENELLERMQISFKSILNFIQEFKPDIIIGFICVTSIEYQAFHIAKELQIKYINLRPSRISNRFFAVSDIFDPPNEIVEDFKNISDNLNIKESTRILNSLKNNFSYEGVVESKKSNKLQDYFKFSGINARFMQRESILSKSFKYLKNILFKNYLFTVYKWRITTKFNSFMSYRYFKNQKNIHLKKYVLFPLHKEPEVQLLLHGAKYQDQYDFIANVASSLPEDTQLVVKEHPMATGYRPISYYKKISKLNKVSVVGPFEDLSLILKNADALITIAGTSAFEAMIKKIPVIHFGDLPFEIVRNSMIVKFKDYKELKEKFSESLKNYKYEENKLIEYIAVCLKHTIPLDFYSLFLNKAENTLKKEDENRLKKLQLETLENYIINKFNL